MQDHIGKITQYFEALNQRDIPRAVSDFAAVHSVRNAAFPAVTGPTAMADTIAGLYERTESVVFVPRSYAEDNAAVLVDWVSTFTFAEGANLNGTVVHKFRVDVKGIDVFTFNSEDEIVDVQIIHETASVARAVVANAAGPGAPDGTDAVDLVSRYLVAEEREDMATLRELFADAVVIRNAATPPDAMPGAVERYMESFWDRTTARSFQLHAAALDDASAVMAYVTSFITFRKGAAFGPVIANHEFTVELPTALRMKLNDAGRIVELDIHHETTTAALLAAGPVA